MIFNNLSAFSFFVYFLHGYYSGWKETQCFFSMMRYPICISFLFCALNHTHTPNHIIVVHLVFNIFITVHFVHCLIYDTYIDLKKDLFWLSWFFHVFTLKSVFSFHVSCVSAGPYIVYIDKNKIK